MQALTRALDGIAGILWARGAQQTMHRLHTKEEL